MKVAWTKEQQKVIDLRDRNILVSAAAGSGKTAVLVERIISMITEGSSPIDIDKLLIVTFTNSAAAQMRERISEAIELKLEEEPENMHLQKQATLVHNAYITTIHSFCLRAIRNHFNQIDLDPSFRIGDEGELKLLRSDVLEKLLERHYEEKSKEFYHFVESYSTGKTDQELENIILQLYQFATSYPWPMEWLDQCIEGYHISSIKELEDSKWYQNIVKNIQITIQEMIEQLDDLLEICTGTDGPYMYESSLREDKKMLFDLLNSASYEAYYECFNSLTFGRLSSKKDENVSNDLRMAVKKQRDDMKKAIVSFKERYFYATPTQILEDIKNCRESVEVLVGLTKKFIEEFKKTKIDKNLIDYNDLEHYALNILIEKETNGWKQTEVAMEYMEFFEEIMIDEYQDSNLVQEMILRAVSKESINRHDVFMVGDVKQSIYKFRLARPELFMEKYNTYSLEDSDCQRIDLDKNFRSRIEVLDGTNFIFHQIMGQALGGIQYNSECALYLGASHLEPIKENDYETEIMVIDLDSAKQEDENHKKSSILEEKEFTAKELEAKVIAARIKELVNSDNGLKVVDKKTKEYRRARYSDIVILLRTMSGWAEVFTSVLMSEGIPAHTGSQTGYFSTIEVITLLNLLRIIDNPLQDIALTAVLTSPIVQLMGEELALIKSTYKDEDMYQACKRYSLEGEDIWLKTKLYHFFEQMEQFRTKAVYTPIHELIWMILEQTNYGRYIAAMPGGEQRKANLDMLVEKAIAFERTSYKGLFNFIRYIEKLQKYDVDFGEAEIVNENDDTVRILSIHKSKGLEFPIVFVSGMGKAFNNQDARAKLIMHPDLGIGADYIDFKLRLKAPTLIKKAIQRQIQMENLGEELRVLYVALTRAKEKLILTGAMSKLENKLVSFGQTMNGKEKLSYRFISEGSNYMEWVLQAAIRHKDSEKFLSNYGIQGKFYELPFAKKAKFEINSVTLEDFVQDEMVTQIIHEDTKEELRNGLKNVEDNERFMKQLNERLDFIYPYEEFKNIHTKMTVSEIKKMGQNIDDTDISLSLIKEEIPIPLLPKFIEEQGNLTGAERGIAYHKALQLLDFKNIETKEDIEDQICKMVEENKMTTEAKESIRASKILKFLHSDIGKRMKRADCEGKLQRERPFVIGVKVNEIKPGLESKDVVLVQGIIDAFFEENGEMILVDYKTDYVKRERELIEKYKAQLEYYEKALNKITGKKVTDKIVYSIYLDKGINIKE